MSAANGEALVSAINRLLLLLDARGVSANEIVACIKPLIADSEARAVAAAVTALTCTHHNDKQRVECPVCLVAALTTERDLLCACLRDLVDEQNGAPLELRRKQWQAAMDEALAALTNTEDAT